MDSSQGMKAVRHGGKAYRCRASMAGYRQLGDRLVGYFWASLLMWMMPSAIGQEVPFASSVPSPSTAAPPSAVMRVAANGSSPTASVAGSGSPAGSPSPASSSNPGVSPSSNVIPSLEAAAPSSRSATTSSPASAPVRSSTVALPNSSGQYWMEYDLRPYTQNLKSLDRPQQAVIDWILRDTGTDVWFSEPTGILTADRNTLRVYHNEGMQQIVKHAYERFVNGPIEPQLFGLRIITINNPNWRQRALAWMRSVEVESPGVQGWLLNKENAAMLLAMLRSRGDVRETPLPELTLMNGQTQNIEQLRSRNYVREYLRQEQPYIAYVPVNDEIQEGFRLELSPLMSTDLKTMDVHLKCSIDQVEKLNQVAVDLPTAMGGLQSAQVSVPQLVSWRLHERFRWPTDQVLVLSCGVIAAPTASSDNTLLNNPSATAFFGLNRLLPTAAGLRADALLVIEYRGDAARQLPSTNAASTTPMAGNPVSRGRY
jgi:hypothetical protein